MALKMKDVCVKIDLIKVVLLVILKLRLKVLASVYFSFLCFIYLNQLYVFLLNFTTNIYVRNKNICLKCYWFSQNDFAVNKIRFECQNAYLVINPTLFKGQNNIKGQSNSSTCPFKRHFKERCQTKYWS